MGVFWVGLLVLGCAVGFVHYGYIGTSIGTLLLGGAVLWRVISQTRKVAERVILSGIQIEAWNYGGKYLRLLWSQIQEIREINVISQHGSIKVVRLISSDQQQQIVLTHFMTGFTELMRQIRAKTPHARAGGRLTFWERLVRWGF